MKLSLVFVFLTSGVQTQSQNSEPAFRMGITPYYSHQRHVKSGIDWGDKHFNQQRHGGGLSGEFTRIRNGWGLGLGIGSITDYHVRDSLTVSCGSQYCLYGYTVNKYTDVFLSLALGYQWDLSDKFTVRVLTQWSGFGSMRRGTKWFVYPNELYDAWESSWIPFRHYQHFMGGRIVAERSIGRGALALSIGYLHPLNRLDKDYDSFAQINFGVGWVFNLKSRDG